jgi:hypothetical protein
MEGTSGRAVSDQDFNFNPPPRREVKRTFEPPPWEREQFEELARRKEAERIAAEAAAGAVSEVPVVAEAPEITQQPAPKIGPVTQDPAGKTKLDTAGGIDAAEDARAEALLIGLRNEDPPFGEELWKVAVAAGAVLASVGAILVVWGVFAIATVRRTGATGSLGGGILVVFGLGFVGVGGWMAFRTLRQQGVL